MQYQLTQRARSSWWILAACAAPLLVLLLAACGGSDSDSAVASVDGDDASSNDDQSGEPAGDAEEELLDWVECMRDQGVDIPDPEVDADGNLTLGSRGGGGGGSEIDPDALEEASEVCGEIPQGAFGAGQMDQTEMQDTMLEFAQCMRDNGYDMPDPDLSGGVRPGAFGDIDPNDPAFQDAAAACEDIFAGARRSGGGGDSAEEG
jgi:hypothetical protein